MKPSDAQATKSLLITGAASGLGLQLAVEMAETGHCVYGAFRGVAPDDGVGIHWIKADMQDHGSLGDVVTQIVQHGGQLDCLVCNAAVQGIGHTADLPLMDWQQTLDINLTAPFLLTQAAAPALKAARGLIIYISSVHGIRAAQERAAYAVSKAGLNALARNVAADFASDGVRAVSLVLGPFHSPALEQGVGRFFPGSTGEEAIHAFAARQPLGRVGTGQDLAAAIRFLMSENAGFISGVELAIDGGQSSRLNIPDLGGREE